MEGKEKSVGIHDKKTMGKVQWSQNILGKMMKHIVRINQAGANAKVVPSLVMVRSDQ